MNKSTAPAISEFHPLADIFPMMNDDEFAMLVADVRVNGLINPIRTFAGKIIDGRNRYYACLETETELRFLEWFGEEKDIASFVVSLNLHRRHLNESQRAMVAARLANIKQGARADYIRKKPEDGDIEQVTDLPIGTSVTQEEAARLLNVSVRSVRRARSVQENAIGEVQKQVETGQLSVSQAEKISRETVGAQIKLIKRNSGGGALLNSKLRNKVKKLVSKAKSTSDVCLMCNPQIEVTDASFNGFLEMLKNRVGGKYARYLDSVMEEIESMEIPDAAAECYELIFRAVDGGFQTFGEMRKRTGMSSENLSHFLKLMVENKKLEKIQQGGKTEMARGGRKTLYIRPAEKDNETEQEYYARIRREDLSYI